MMQAHTLLDEDKLTKITMFKDENGKILGLITYDTCYEDRVYLIHLNSDKELLDEMVDYIIEDEENNVVIKVNSKDISLCEVLQEKQFIKADKDVSVLQLDLEKDLSYRIPDGYSISPLDFKIDNLKYQLVIHKGFNHEDIPEMWDSKYFEPTPNYDVTQKVFALHKGDYCAHCGVWYTRGDTVYIEPVVTVPQHRKRGLAKAVVYEAVRRTKSLGAKRQPYFQTKNFIIELVLNVHQKCIVGKKVFKQKYESLCDMFINKYVMKAFYY